MEIGRERLQHATVIRLVGELDLATAPEVLAAVQSAVAEDGDGRLVLDMREVSFIDSTGVRALLEASRATETQLALLRPSSAVTRVLDLTQLRGHVPEVPDLEPASLDAVNQG